MPGAEKEAETIEPWAAAIALATVMVVWSVAGFTVWERARRAQLEQVITPTAVGDTHYVQEPKAGSGPMGLKYLGRGLVMVSEGKMRDALLIRVGADDSGVYSLYRPEDEKALPKGHFFMKANPNDFVEVTGE